LNKKTLPLLAILFIVLLLPTFGLVNIGLAHSIPRTHDMVVASIWGPATVDPACAYDTASGALIFNLYDTLIHYYVNHSLPADQQGRTDQFVGDLATEWKLSQPPIAGAPAYVSSTYYFKIRSGVPYHDAAYGTVTPSDVEYSFERWMAFDRSGGPTWMIYEPLLDIHYANWTDPAWAAKIDNAVESNATHVWFNLAVPNYQPMIFMQVIAQGWAGVMPRAWAADMGCWPGEIYTNANMTAYYDPPVSPLDDYPVGTGGRVECGSGPYTLGDFDAVGHTYRLDWFPSYYAGWPYAYANQYGYNGQCGYDEGWLKTVTFRGIDEWATRKSMFLAGNCDSCYVSTMDLPEMVTNWDENPSWEEEEYPLGIKCYPGLPGTSQWNLFPVMNINVTGNTYIGDGDHDSMYETGIPYWFFNDTHTGYTTGGKPLRKAFAYCFNWTEYINEVLRTHVWGEGIQPPSPLIKGTAYWQYLWDVVDSTDDLAYTNGVPDPDAPGSDLDPPDTPTAGPYSQPLLPNGSGPWPPNPLYYINFTKAEEMFKAAWDGEIWSNGFTFAILYNSGNTLREFIARMLEENVESLNAKFHIDVLEVDWPTYLDGLFSMTMPFFIIGWLEDYPDPHNWFYPYMHSDGTFSQWQAYSDPEVDALIEAGVTETDDNKRIEIYWKLCNKYFEDAVSFPLFQGTNRHWERDWMEGWYYNPVYPGSYWYHLWKGYAADVNHDYVVNQDDLDIVMFAYDSHPCDGDWNPCADVDNDGYVGLSDVNIVCSYMDGEQPPRISVDPPYSRGYYVGEKFQVAVNVSVGEHEDHGLFGYAFKLYWNRTLLNVASVTHTPPSVWGSNWVDVGAGLVWDYNATHGRFETATTALLPAEEVFGDFTLVTLDFEVMHQPNFPAPDGYCLLDLVDTQLGGKDGYVISHDTFDGEYEVKSVIWDIAVTDIYAVSCSDYSIQIDKTVVCHNRSACFNVTVTNEGLFVETTNVTLWAQNVSTIQVGDPIPVTLAPGATEEVTFTFNSTGIPIAKYLLFANATAVPGETEINDNTHINGFIFVAHSGDLDGDGHVFLYDLTVLGTAWDSKPGDDNWCADADIDGDGHVRLYDLTIIGSHWDEYN
jgi:peptide/nickel transport system substrate-binding protein